MQSIVHWGNVPLVRLVIPLIVGVILGIEFPVYLFCTAAVAVVILLLVTMLVLSRKQRTRLSGIVMVTAMLLAGYALSVSSNEFLQGGHFAHQSMHGEQSILLQVDEPLVRK